MRDFVQKKEPFDEVISEIKKDPEYGLKTFYGHYGRFITLVAKSYCYTDDLVDEVVNDVLVKVWEYAYKPYEIEKPKSWLFTITANCAKDKLKVRKLYSLDREIAIEENRFDEIIAQESFFSLISGLKDEECYVMILRFENKYTLQEIAQEIDKPLGSVSSIYYRALKKIKRKIKKVKKNTL